MFTDKWRLTLWIKTPNNGMNYRKQRVLFFKSKKALFDFIQDTYYAAQISIDNEKKTVSCVVRG